MFWALAHWRKYLPYLPILSLPRDTSMVGHSKPWAPCNTLEAGSRVILEPTTYTPTGVFALQVSKKNEKLAGNPNWPNWHGFPTSSSLSPSRTKKEAKTYNTRYSLVVTDPTTNPALTGLSMGERTGSRVFQWVWSLYLKLRINNKGEL
ncbi:hypothetical protein LZ32DRAFT_615573 [Colletotrichum eremochloae]|nr:hypothetical protein LZ32DRAFT_615573 [Colletotrichum eremochloae]